MTTEELQSLFELKVSQLKARYKYKKKYNEVDFTEVYVKSIEQLDRIRIHSEIDLFPESLFINRAPNQTEVEFKYIKANYKSVTLPVWQQFQSAQSRIWGDQNWKIQYNGNDDAKQYLENDYPVYGSHEVFFKDVITTTKEKDNNGAAVLKIDIPYLPFKNERGENVYPVISDRDMLRPATYYYSCDKIIGFKEDVYGVVLTNANSPIQRGSKTLDEGLVFDIYDKNFIYRAFQFGKQEDFTFELIEYIKHDLNRLPFKKLNGLAVQMQDEVFYQSSFISAVDSLDKCVLDDSYLMASKAKCAYPKEWEYTSECDYRDETTGNACIAGVVQTNEGSHTCPSCAGTGKQRPGILGIKQIKISEYGNQQNVPTPPGGFYGPDLNPLIFLSDQIDKNLNKAASILNIDISNSNVKGSDTALGKQIDREEQFAFIKRISDQTFQLFEFFTNVLIEVRFGKGSQLPSITYPRTFALRNDADLTTEIAEAQLAGLPDGAIKRLQKDYYETRFGTDVDQQKIIDLTYSVDRLNGLSNDDIIKKIATGTVAKWEDILHTSIEIFIEKLISKNNNFLDLSLDQQEASLISLAKAKDLEINPALMSIDSVLGAANSAVTDKEAEAAANLRGSVGGSQVIIDLVMQVSAGTMDRTAAINTLIFLFKIDEEQASKLLGPIKKIASFTPPNANA